MTQMLKFWTNLISFTRCIDSREKDAQSLLCLYTTQTFNDWIDFRVTFFLYVIASKHIAWVAFRQTVYTVFKNSKQSGFNDRFDITLWL